MVIKLAYDDDEDLPWDGVWEYVLGPDDAVLEPRRGRTNRRNPAPTSDIFDYFLPPVDEAQNRGRPQSRPDPVESYLLASKPLKRDTSAQSSVASSRGSSASASKRLFWRRKEKIEYAQEDEFSIVEVINSFIEDPPEDQLEERVAVPVDSGAKEGKRQRSPGTKKATLLSASNPFTRDTSLQSSAASSRGSHVSASKRRFWRRKEKIQSPPEEEEYSIVGVLNSFIEDPPEESSSTPQRLAVAVDSDAKGGKRKGFWRRRSSEEDRSDMASIESMLGPWQGGSVEMGKKRASSTKRNAEGKRSSSTLETNPTERNRRGSARSMNQQPHERRNSTGSAKPLHRRRDSLGGGSTGSVAESMLLAWTGEHAASDVGSEATSTKSTRRTSKERSSKSSPRERRNSTGPVEFSDKRRDCLEGSPTESIAESVYLAFTAEPTVSDLGSEASNSTRMSRKVEKKPRRMSSKERRSKSKAKQPHGSSGPDARDETDESSLPAFAILSGLASWINTSFSDSEASSDYSSFQKNNITKNYTDDMSLMTTSTDASSNNGRDVSPARVPPFRQSTDRELPVLDEEIELDEVHLQFRSSVDPDMNYGYLTPIMEETRSVRTSDEDKSPQRRPSGSEDERTSAEASTSGRREQARLHTASPAMGSEKTSRASNAGVGRNSNRSNSGRASTQEISHQDDESTSSSWAAPHEIYETRRYKESEQLFQSIDDDARAMSSRGSGARTPSSPPFAYALSSPVSDDRELISSPLTEGRALSPQESEASKSWMYQESESSSNLGVSSPSSKFRIRRTKFLGGIRDFHQVPRFACSNDGRVATHELSSEDVAEMFPKLRVVSDEAGSFHKAEVRGSKSFDAQSPAQHLQFPMTDSVWPRVGEMQYVCEYEYEKGKHMKVVYCYFGPNPRDTLQVVSYETPPQSAEEGLVSFNKVVVQVEASTVSLMDCFVRRGGEVGERPVSLPNTPGIDLVGKLYRIDKESSRKFDLKVGQRVISLVRSGGNSRYLGVDPAALVKVPEAIDPAEAVCLVESYLAGFQMLHTGQGQLMRYRKTALYGITILVIGGMASNTGRAIAELSRLAGAKHIFATAKQKHFKKLNSLGVLPLNLDPFVWCTNLEGSIDLLISLGEELLPVHYKLLKTTGTIVSCSEEYTFSSTSSSQAPSNNPVATKMPPIVCSKLVCSQIETHEYNLFKEWDDHRTRSKADLAHLVHLLDQGRIRPSVLDRIPLTKVARAQEHVESKHHAGFIVCEPWLVSKARTVSL
jgi:NADPH:quinone reductase-like Zn-dependent oxidoreductase